MVAQKSVNLDVAGRNSSDRTRPALLSIPAACRYMGDVSRAKFYADVLPQLETVHIGTRHFVVVASMDRLIAKLRKARTDRPQPTKQNDLRARVNAP
jgi:hypothetical protein